MTFSADAEAIVLRAREHALTVAVAESLTGGMVADAIVSLPGASDVFVGGVVSYHTDLKRSILGVDEKVLRDRGPVDALVAEQMASGVRVACSVRDERSDESVLPDVGVSVTGVAGPSPDAVSSQHPGIVWVGVSSRLGNRSERFEFQGDRTTIRRLAMLAALEILAAEVELLSHSA